MSGYGGSLSGEHGDGQQRGELLSIMFGDGLVGAFDELKSLFDPLNRMNPGKIVRPRPLDADLRWGRATGRPILRPRSPPDDDHRFARAATAVSGSGSAAGTGPELCARATASPATNNLHAGRARLLFEMLQGDVVTEGWRSPQCGTPWTCVWPVRAAAATVRSTSTWPPTRRNSCTTTTNTDCARCRTTRWAGCPS